MTVRIVAHEFVSICDAAVVMLDEECRPLFTVLTNEAVLFHLNLHPRHCFGLRKALREFRHESRITSGCRR